MFFSAALRTPPSPTITPHQEWDQPETVADPEAKKPEDWDDDMDGEWEPPVIDNPDFKGMCFSRMKVQNCPFASCCRIC